MKLILLRHGESQWNLENRFTGWEDVSLTTQGKREAAFSGHQILNKNLKIESIHTSLLNRAIETTIIVSKIIKFPKRNIQFDWRLNERHYGALQGLNKSETAAKYGEEKVKIWRRSYDVHPPLLDSSDVRHPKFNNKFKEIKELDLPSGESLKQVINRLTPFLDNYFNFIRKSTGSHLIIAHSNSLRAIVKVLDQLNEKEIISVNIPTGVPLLYSFDSNFKVLSKEYLIDEKELKKKQEIIKNQGKAN